MRVAQDLLAAEGRGRALAILAALLSPVLFWVSYSLVDAIVKPAIGDAGPAWLADEVGIAVTGALWLAAGLARLKDSKRAPGIDRARTRALDRPAPGLEA